MRMSIMHSLPGMLTSVWHLTVRDGSHTCHCLPLSKWARAGSNSAQQGRVLARRRVGRAAAAAKSPDPSAALAAASSDDPFYSPAEVSLDSVGYHRAVVDALRAAGYQRPSQVQVQAASP
jgi:hypothetical protein